ncbi:putative ribonuclease H-like domain-containing protein [Senna tora]|uniref:Putative ribonuclease H-like domain-containing protein n=1 Tax=Senna tora TaxID=362788 RepID=A0A834T644_9FABA|nr:putative ribonuclease H-like domain-containing protein [Senna tora]
MALRVKQKGPQLPKDSNIIWIPPEASMFKINVDGSCWENDMSISCGGVIRDAGKRWIIGFSKNLGKGNILLAKMWGIRMGLQIAKFKGLSNSTIETDSLAAVKLIKGNSSESHPLYAITEDIRRMLIPNGSMNLVHIPRNANRVADTMAKQGHLLSFGDFLYEEPPAFSSIVYQEDSPVHQMQRYYRLGEFDNCFEKWNALVDCLTLKTKSSSEVQEVSFFARVSIEPSLGRHWWVCRRRSCGISPSGSSSSVPAVGGYTEVSLSLFSVFFGYVGAVHPFSGAGVVLSDHLSAPYHVWWWLLDLSVAFGLEEGVRGIWWEYSLVFPGG